MKSLGLVRMALSSNPPQRLRQLGRSSLVMEGLSPQRSYRSFAATQQDVASRRDTWAAGRATSNPRIAVSDSGTPVTPPTQNNQRRLARPRASNPKRFEIQSQRAMRKTRQKRQVPAPPHRQKASNPTSNPTSRPTLTRVPPASLRNPTPVLPPSSPRNPAPVASASQQSSSTILPASEQRTVADHLIAAGEPVATGCWVQISNISPLSSLDAMLIAVRSVLQMEDNWGIVDIDQNYSLESSDHSSEQVPPFLDTELDSPDWVLQARLVLSSFGRPSAWRLKFRNRSIVNALLTHTRENELIMCGWSAVKVDEWKEGGSSDEVDSFWKDQPFVSDATLRVENCPERGVNELDLMNFFSRYDLSTERPAVERWKGRTPHTVRAPVTFLVHFADASWARAALRERQGAILGRNPLRLVQFPRQMM